MKKIQLLFILITGWGFSPVFSQNYNFKVTETSKVINENGSKNVLVVNIYETNEDIIRKEWKSQLKDLGAKVSTDNNKLTATNATIKEFGNLPFNVFSVIEKTSEGYYQLIVGVDLGGAFMESAKHPDKYKIFSSLMADFAKRLTRESVESQVKAAGKELEKRQSEQDKLTKENEKLNSNIKKWQEEIKKAESDIEENLKKQEEQKKKIEDAKDLMDTIRLKLKNL